jgi:2-polyprenyl-3-methyl-5-hydroxy-6-metoxy-1,4-benzoquinol methylase
MMDNEPVIGNYYDKHATKNPVERYLVCSFEKVLKGLIAESNPKKVLEIGCGEGHVVQIVKDMFPECHYTAIDIDSNLLGLAKEKGADDTFLSTIESVRFPYDDDSFDLVLMVEILEHLESPLDGLLEANRLCASHIIASVPNEPLWRILNMLRLKYMGSLGNTPGHINHWGKHTFTKLISSQFDLMKIKSPLPWVMILGQKKQNAKKNC